MNEDYRAVFYHPESDALYVDTAANHLENPYTSAVCEEVDASDLKSGLYVAVGAGYARILPDMDFETYSEAGFYLEDNKWKSIANSAPHGLGAVGAAVYSEHPSTEVLSLAYNLKNGTGAQLWLPGMPPPQDLFDHIAKGGLIEAANSAFEYFIWNNVCHKKMGWPPLDRLQLRDPAAKARAFSLPGALGKLAKVLNVRDLKIDDGKRLIQKFSVPRNPTAKDKRLRHNPYDIDMSEDAQKLYEYNIGDIKAESAVSACIPDLSPEELELWLLDQKINFKGVYIDHKNVDACLEIVRQANEVYTAKLVAITDGQVQTVGEIKKLLDWANSNGARMRGMTSDDVDAALKRDNLPENVRQALEIRSILGSASVKKLHSIKNRLCTDMRIRDIFMFCGADRTGRWAGRGPQPQNLPNSGPKVRRCDPVSGCGHHSSAKLTDACPWCSAPDWALKEDEWTVEAVEDALEVIRYGRLDLVEKVFGDPIATVSGCLRGMFAAAPGHEFICSDYSAIEAVVLACMAGEQWRIDVFNTHAKIYEMSASKITGVPFEEMMRHFGYTDAELAQPDWYKRKPKSPGSHHPSRKKIGKVSELASGYQGGVGAWCAFGADAFMSEEEMKVSIKKWRAESPMIVKFWYGLEDAAKNAVQYPGQYFGYRGIYFGMKDDVLYCRLLSGRKLAYHSPRLHKDVTPWGKEVLKLTYMGMDSVTKQWLRIDTYGGKLTENIVQATARDILAHALINVDKAGYTPVIHVHDEIVAEVPAGYGTIEEFEKIMATMPAWCSDWPIKAAGGWRGKRYRKD